MALPGQRHLCTCVLLTALWSLLGAAACAGYFVISRLPVTPTGRVMPPWLDLTELVLAFVMIPLCVMLPLALLLAGWQYLDRIATADAARMAVAARWRAAWTTTAQGSVLVEGFFIFRLCRHFLAQRENLGISWHAFDFSMAFLIAGAAMTCVLIAATRSAAAACSPHA
jgi:hypothetical protein